MSAKAQELAARYGRNLSVVEIAEKIIAEQDDTEQLVDQSFHINAFTHPLCPIVTSNPDLQYYRWGLIPSWVKTEDQAKEIENMTINAKAETIFEKPSFRNPILFRRCIVPSTGFFEWRHEGRNKIPYYILLKEQEIFSIAGIYEAWNNCGKIVYSFSIITTEANELMSFIHNTKKRMPVILPQEKEMEWLNPNLTKEDIRHLLIPFDTDAMDAYTIKSNFLRMNPKDERVIALR